MKFCPNCFIAVGQTENFHGNPIVYCCACATKLEPLSVRTDPKYLGGIYEEIIKKVNPDSPEVSKKAMRELKIIYECSKKRLSH